jgi:hypothetical protein
MRPHRFALIAAACIAAAPGLSAAQTVGADRFVSGGIGEEERAELRTRARDYDLWLVTAAKHSGAYLANVQARVIDQAGRTVVETTLAGQWLLAKLEPGTYRVEATAENGQTLSETVRVGGDGPRRLVLRFDIPAGTLATGATR